MKAIKQVMKKDQEPYRVPKRVQDVGEIQDILEHSGFYMIDARIQEVAQGLGLQNQS